MKEDMLKPKQIRDIRKRMDMTQQQLADHLGYQLQMIQRWEWGLNKPKAIVGKYLKLYLKHHRL